MLLPPQASGILCLAIIGGAVIPIFQGLLADAVGLQMSLSLALVSYTYMAFFAVCGYKPTTNLIKEQVCDPVMKKMTMQDVAERAGVSSKTVSRVINNEPRVSESTRKKIYKSLTS